MKTFYLFFKIYNSNSLLRIAEKYGLAYIGFQDEFAGKETNEIGFHLLKWLANAPPKERENVRLVSFYEREIYFWEITGNLLECSTTKEKRKVIEGLEKELSEKEKKCVNGPNTLRLLPVKACKKFKSDLLYASIDSLSVYSYLNMGTCRPFCRIGKSNHLYPGEFRKISVVFTYPSVKGKEELEETEHGVFCRLYFDSMLGINNDYKEMIKKLSEEEINQLVFATMNPAQYRALVFYILIDLGWTPPDVATGKALNVIDVRDKIIHCPETKFKALMEKLQELLHNPTDKLKHSIDETKAVSIQCKAYSDVSLGNEDYIVLKPDLRSSRGKKAFRRKKYPNSKRTLSKYR